MVSGQQAYITSRQEPVPRQNYVNATSKTYVECVSLFARYFERSPEELGLGHIREYQRYLVEEKRCSWSRFNLEGADAHAGGNPTHGSGWFVQVLPTRLRPPVPLRQDAGKDWVISHIPFPRKQKKLPVVVSCDEAAQFLGAIEKLMCRTALWLCYGATANKLSPPSHSRRHRLEPNDDSCPPGKGPQGLLRHAFGQAGSWPTDTAQPTLRSAAA